jgi:ADP-ribose pyrophosphatase YjhB (NUDIX family)
VTPARPPQLLYPAGEGNLSRVSGHNESVKDAYCSYCGTAFAPAQPWPRACRACGNVTYQNPLPVAVMLVPIEENGLLLIRRTIPPREGSLALPGGFIGMGETWQEAAARELHEETGLTAAPSEVRLFDTLTSPAGFLLVFGVIPPRAAADLAAFAGTDETSELVIATEPVELAFPLHNEAAARFWRERGG